MITLDTDVISQLLRPRPSAGLVQRLASVPANDHSTTAITMGELAYGAAKAGRADLYDRARSLLTGVTVFPFDAKAAHRYGLLRADLERQGQRLSDPDLRIAAIALARKLTLVTGNVRHFSRVLGLSVENWLRG